MHNKALLGKTGIFQLSQNWANYRHHQCQNCTEGERCVNSSFSPWFKKSSLQRTGCWFNCIHKEKRTKTKSILCSSNQNLISPDYENSLAFMLFQSDSILNLSKQTSLNIAMISKPHLLSLNLCIRYELDKRVCRALATTICPLNIHKSRNTNFPSLSLLTEASLWKHWTWNTTNHNYR